jgi:hypothetical protein
VVQPPDSGTDANASGSPDDSRGTDSRRSRVVRKGILSEGIEVSLTDSREMADGRILRFDLTKSSADAKQFRQSWRALGTVFVLAGAGMAVFGILLFGLHLGTSGPAYDIDVGVFSGVGAVIAVASWPLARQGRAYPTSLSVSAREITLDHGSKPEPRLVSWKDSKFKLGLIDRKGLPATHPDGTPRPRFAFQPSGSGPWTPIPAEAFDALLSHAESNGLHVVRRTIRSPRVPGTYEKITIQAPRQPD